MRESQQTPKDTHWQSPDKVNSVIHAGIKHTHIYCIYAYVYTCTCIVSCLIFNQFTRCVWPNPPSFITLFKSFSLPHDNVPDNMCQIERAWLQCLCHPSWLLLRVELSGNYSTPVGDRRVRHIIHPSIHWNRFSSAGSRSQLTLGERLGTSWTRHRSIQGRTTIHTHIHTSGAI